MTDTGLVRQLQERAARACPAAHVAHVAGWWLRVSDGAAWWAGTVLPHGDPPASLPGDPPSRLPAGPRDISPTGSAATSVDPLAHGGSGTIGSARAGLLKSIALVESFYACHGAPARFQISPGACPEALDACLAERGYRIECPMWMLRASAVEVADRLPTDDRISLHENPTPAWFDAWQAVHGAGTDPGPELAMLERVRVPSVYASARAPSGVVSVGRAVLDTGWAGIFGMATLPSARGRGAAARVLGALAHWAALRGATHLYLQVEPDNIAALRLYARAGFAELFRYHYRTRPKRTALQVGSCGTTMIWCSSS